MEEHSAEGSGMEGDKDKITVVYEDADGHRPIPINGAFGGLTPNGESVVAHAYIEHNSIPNLVTHNVDEQGRVNLSEGDPILRGEITRKVETTLTMSPEAAVRIGQWLMEKGQFALEERERRNSGGASQ